MKNDEKTLKTLAFSLGLVVLLLSATNLNAQDNNGNRGLFNRGTDYEKDEKEQDSRGLMNRGADEGEGFHLFNQQFGTDEEGGFELQNQTFGQDDEGETDDAPLGSGLLILTAAGAGYALRKRKNNDNNQES